MKHRAGLQTTARFCWARCIDSIFVMPGSRDILVIFLTFALKLQKVIIAATLGAGKLSANRRARLVNTATAGIAVKEVTDASEMCINLSLHNALIAVVLAGIAFLGRLKFHIKMSCQPHYVALGQYDYRIAAAISRTV